MKTTARIIAIISGLILALAMNSTAIAQSAKKKSAKPAAKAAPAKKAAAPKASSAKSPVTSGDRQLTESISMIRSGQYERALSQLYTLSKRNELSSKYTQIKYYIGVALLELKLKQAAAFQFVTVIKAGGPLVRNSIEKLSLIADDLGDDTLLNYAISKAELSNFPEQYKDVIYFRLGEIKLRNRSFGDAIQLFDRVKDNTRYYHQAQYNKGLAFLEAKDPNAAVRVFQRIIDERAQAPITDDMKVAARLALARAYYQGKDWDSSLSAYRDVPRDHIYWHNALFESSWAYMRTAKFRSALSNFQSLHSDYYDNFYQPESLLLRSIVYLYICKYDEMEKVLEIYEKSYEKTLPSVIRFAKSDNFNELYQEVAKAFVSRTKNGTPNTKLPYNILRHVALQGDTKRSLLYLNKLLDERRLLSEYKGLVKTTFGKYLQTILNNRIKNTQNTIGEITRAHLVNIANDVRDFNEQAAFVRFEMISGQKEAMKKKIAGKDLPQAIDEKIDRTFFVQNGYEYWPFQGEYWLDEIGNYQYLGQQSCE